LTNEEAQRFSLVLGQISGAGVLKGQDLNQVLQLPGFSRGQIAKEIAKEMKIGVDEATKLLGNGKVDSTTAIRAIVHAGLASHGLGPDANAPNTPEGQLTGVDRGIAESSTSIDTKLSQLDNRILELKRTLGQKLADAGFIEDLNKLVDVLQKTTEWATKAYDAIHKFGLAKGAGVTAVETLTGPADAKGAQRSTLTEGQAGFAANLRQLFMSKEELDKFYLDVGARTALALDQGMANGLTGATKAEQAATDMAGRVIDATNAGAGVHSPSVYTAETGKYLDEGLAMGIEGDQELAFSAAQA
jgi:tape measure domain-containing protein